MKKFFAFCFLAFSICSISIDVTKVSADVLGTSVTVTRAVDEIDIRKIETEKVGLGGNLLSSIYLKNLGGDRKSIDRVVVTVSKLDGTVKLNESIEVEKSVFPAEETELNVQIPNSLEEGEYIGLYEIYSNNELLGNSKSIITIPKAQSQVLGAESSVSAGVFLLISGIVFLFLLIVNLVLLLRKPSWLKKNISFGWEDIVFLITGVSAFGIGFCGGYFIAPKFLP